MTLDGVVLAGCQPEPLGSYLKALGMLRLAGDQIDRQATGWWASAGFVLACGLDADGLVAFLCDDYRPTPLVAPWNGGSGFGPKDQQRGIAAIEASNSPRLAAYREAVSIGRRIAADAAAHGWSKERTLVECRNHLPDEAIGWLDASVVLTADGPGYAPLLGTGGNDGRLEFSNNFMQRLVDVLAFSTPKAASGRSTAEGWARAALFSSGGPAALKGVPIGQFDPGAAGGSNSSSLGKADSLVNPWDYVLLLEGAVGFAGGLARRFGGGRGRAVMPFTFDAVPIGYPSSAPDERSRGELWAPLWTASATAQEVGQLLREGRARWRGRQARNGLDMARAATSLGVDRGVAAFSRHVFVERFGLSTVAVPAGRLRAVERPEVALLADIDPWLDRVRRAGPLPAGTESLLRRAQGAVFAVAAHGGGEALAQVLIALARLETAVARSVSLRQEIPPVAGLAAERWVSELLNDDASAELRLAAALASLHDANRSGEVAGSLQALLRPVAATGRHRPPIWAERGVEGAIRANTIADVLAAAHVRRVIEVEHHGRIHNGNDGSEPAQPGVSSQFSRGLWTRIDDICDWLGGLLDDRRLGELLAGLVLLDWWDGPAGGVLGQPVNLPMVPAAFALLAPCYAAMPVKAGRAEVSVLPEARWASMLAAHRTADVLDAAGRRLRMAGLELKIHHFALVASTAPPGPRLAAALLCRLRGGLLSLLLGRVAVPGRDLEADFVPDRGGFR